MSRGDLECLSRDELIKLVLKLQRPAKTSRPSSKPPSTDRKERCEQSRPGRAKPSHEGHSRVIAEDPDTVVDRRPSACPDCGLALSPELPTETISVHEHIELPEVKPVVEQHRLAVVCPGCRARVAAPRPTGAAAMPFGPRLHAAALYLKMFQASSYERLQKALSDLSGLRISQGGLTEMPSWLSAMGPSLMLRRAETRFDAGREAALSALRRATMMASDETGVRIEGTNSYHWFFRCEAVVHHAAPTRGACVVHEIVDGHRPTAWLSNRYSAQQRHADRQQTCLAHLPRDVAYALDAGDDTPALCMELWLKGAFALARTITTVARDIQNRMRRARDQLLTFAAFPDGSRRITTPASAISARP